MSDTGIARQVLARLTTFAAVTAALLLSAVFSVAAAAPAAAAPSGGGSVTGLTFTNVNNGRALDVQNGNSGDGTIIVTNAPGYHTTWHLNVNPRDSSFAVVNDANGKCLDAGVPNRLQPCDGRGGEKWYFQPTGAPNTFMIRHADDKNCLDVLLGATYNDAWTGSYGCNNTKPQQWTVPAAAQPQAFQLAVAYAAGVCTTNAGACSWTAESQTPAAPLPKQCISPVWYNGTQKPVPWTFSLKTTTGWTTALGFEFQTTIGSGEASPIAASVSNSIKGEVTYNLTQELGSSLEFEVPPANYGWVSLSELATKVTGKWTFDVNGFPWTANDTITVPLRNDNAGHASIYVAETSPTFTTCGS
ncbi:RICIN domain-containing protein [Streptomyces sp. RS10V-4]|uniref:RICIN domain-containing protein n=1 Tax=Streptomyces rhizoryzae TaxID=2932493 RepID=UPI00200515E9|nr:RICIN domain-containing protein [Streptomyces rhizoryzae]MCK7622185.1 RICIN domain-containing protein [Streptomyces rhizoryzae]